MNAAEFENTKWILYFNKFDKLDNVFLDLDLFYPNLEASVL